LHRTFSFKPLIQKVVVNLFEVYVFKNFWFFLSIMIEEKNSSAKDEGLKDNKIETTLADPTKLFFFDNEEFFFLLVSLHACYI